MKHSFGSFPHVLDLVTILRLGLQHLIFDDIVVHHFDVHLMKHGVVHTFKKIIDLFVDLLNDFQVCVVNFLGFHGGDKLHYL
jgi:hypothetical protein